MTRRRVFLLSMAGALNGCYSPDNRRRLNVLNWGDYIAPGIVGEFEREFDAKVRYGTYENNEELFGKVMSGNSGWDIVFPTQNRVEPMRQLGLIAKLDQRRLAGGLANLFPQFQRPPWDPSLDWCVPYMWTTTGIAYNRVRYPAQPTSWADLWDARTKGKMTMLDDVDDVFGAALAKLGYPYNSANADHLKAAQREVIAQKQLVRAYLSTEGRDQMVAGDVLIAQTFATTAQLAIDGNSQLTYVHPKEPFPVYCDCAVLLHESRRADLGHEFLNYLLRPQVSATIAHAIRTATPNQKAFEAFLPKEERLNRTLYPTADVLSRAEWPLPLPPEIVRLRDRLWTEVKSA